MLVDEASIRDALVRMVRRLTSNAALRDDLLQESLVHLWLTEASRPGQTRSWYLQSCKYHLLHYLAAGRSVDSAKRRASQAQFVDDPEERQEMLEEQDSEDSVLGWVSARDLIAMLSPQLNLQEKSVLDCFADGLGLREIGRKLGISHTMVIRHRRRIASLLNRLERNNQLVNGTGLNSPRLRHACKLPAQTLELEMPVFPPPGSGSVLQSANHNRT